MTKGKKKKRKRGKNGRKRNKIKKKRKKKKGGKEKKKKEGRGSFFLLTALVLGPTENSHGGFLVNCTALVGAVSRLRKYIPSYD